MRAHTTGSSDADVRGTRVSAAVESIITRRLAGEDFPDERIAAHWPDLMPELGDRMRDLRCVESARLAALATDLAPLGDGSSGSSRVRLDQDVLTRVATMLPGYEFLGEIHRGGQGVVFKALQKSTRRQVALKFMRQGPLADARELARFEREVHVLGRLQHANIVAIHDRASAGGFDYYVMDYVDGEPLDRFVSQGGFSTQQTLELFAAVCHAVAAAHVRGVIHRDLKPSNVLVDKHAVPHVLDFGLAKEGMSDCTESGQFLGSLPWTSPEQAAGRSDAVDVRSDVYSLGVMLFHSLTSAFPYDVSASLPIVLDRIIERPPLHPSALRRSLDAEIDAIVLTCLAKEPARRYQSVGELAADLRRYLNHEPITARPPGRLYLLRKFVQRNKALTGVAAALLLAIILGLAGTTWKAMAERAQREQTQREMGKVRAINQVLESVLISPDPFFGTGADTTIVQTMDAVSRKLTDDMRDEPEVEADVRLLLANSFRHLGRIEQAEANVQRGIELRRRLYGDADPRTIEAHVIVAYLRAGTNRLEEAEHLFRYVIDGLHEANGPDDPDALRYSTHHAGVLNRLGRRDEALEILTSSFERHRQVFGMDEGVTLYTQQILARVLSRAGRLAEAEPLFLDVIERRRAANGGDHPATLGAQASYAAALHAAGRAAEAEPILRHAAAVFEAKLGPKHEQTLRVRDDWARALLAVGQAEEAAALSRETLDRIPQDHALVGPIRELLVQIAGSAANNAP